jgi:hypothetical protein
MKYEDTSIEIIKVIDHVNIHLQQNNIYINYKKIIKKALDCKLHYNIILKIIQEKLIKIKKEEIAYLCYDIFTKVSKEENQFTLDFLQKIDESELINFTEPLDINSDIIEDIIDGLCGDYLTIQEEDIKLINYNENYKISLGKILFLVTCADDYIPSVNKKNLIIWLINYIEPDIELLNFSAYWSKMDIFKIVYEKFKINCTNETLMTAVNGVIDFKKKLKFLEQFNCKINNVTYDMCDKFLPNSLINIPSNEKDCASILGYLTSSKLGFKIDNRYIIRSIVYKKLIYFKELYNNYPEIESFEFSKLNFPESVVNELNKRLIEYKSKCIKKN